ncbi:MAG: M56 family metallopeptidase [Anaerohalosphaera sp.]|nr:M56 family metallopeptidase [Anaerohalosphaera sp.]
MNNIPEILLSNVIVVSIGALVIYGVTTIWKNAKIARLLWLILLLKLITPPLFQIPLLGPAPEQAISTEQKLPISMDAPHLALPSIERRVPRRVQYVPAQPKNYPAIQSSLNSKQDKPAITTICGKWIKTANAKINYLYIWIAGSAVWILINIWQVSRLCRLLVGSSAAPAGVQDELYNISKNLRFKTIPKLIFVDTMISPCVWAWKRSSYILISKELFARMDMHQQQTILTHEMAHLRQGDHWLRWLELVIIAVYWWFPVAWWIVKQLHKSGEYCCDSYVYDIYPNKIKAYARALVETVECLSNTNKKVAALGVRNLSGPMLLKRRIKLITEMKGQTKMNWKTKIMAVLIAASTITLSVGYANDKDAEPTDNEIIAAEVIENIDSAELSDETKELIRNTIVDTLDSKWQFITSGVSCIGDTIMIGEYFDLDETDNYAMIEGDSAKCFTIGPDGEMQELDIDEFDIRSIHDVMVGNAIIECGMAGLDDEMQEMDLCDVIESGDIQEIDLSDVLEMQIKSLEKQIELLSKQLEQLKSTIK